MKYFKHFSDASSSLKIQRLIDDLGVEGYGHYFLLLELLSTKFDGFDTKIELHSDEICSKVRIKFTKKLATFIQKLADFSLLSYQISGKVYQIDAPILLDLLDKDSKYNRKKRFQSEQKATLEEDIRIKNKNKNKNKEIDKETAEPIVPIVDKNNSFKTDENKLTSVSQQTNDILKLFNDLAGKHKMPTVKTFNQNRQRVLAKAIKDLGDSKVLWEKIFMVASKKGFVGKDGRTFQPNFDYIFRNNNYISFSEEESSKGGAFYDNLRDENPFRDEE